MGSEVREKQCCIKIAYIWKLILYIYQVGKQLKKRLGYIWHFQTGQVESGLLTTLVYSHVGDH